MNARKTVYVTQPALAPLEDFIPYLLEIRDSKILTNSGPFHKRLEAELCEFPGVNHISLFTNGAIALVTDLQALRNTGEVITTPYSFVAAANSLFMNGIESVFDGIDPQALALTQTRLKRPSPRKRLPIRRSKARRCRP